MTNSFEGKSFVSQNLTENQTLTDYVTQLMPQFNEEQIQETANLYTGIGLDTTFDQASGIMGECQYESQTVLRNCLTDILHSYIYLSDLLPSECFRWSLS